MFHEFVLPREKGDVWAIYWVITPNETYVVKGGSKACDAFMGKRSPIRIYRYTYWPIKKEGYLRAGWRSRGLNFFDEKPRDVHKVRQIHLRDRRSSLAHWFCGPRHANFCVGDIYNPGGKRFYYRRFPKFWQPEWNEFIDLWGMNYSRKSEPVRRSHRTTHI